VLCSANANLTRDEQPAEILRFVEFWHDLTGHDPEWLYFDSKLTTYAELSRLNQRGVHFVTIRRRGTRLVQKILARPAGDWTSAVIDIPKRRQKRVRYLEQPVRLPDYEGPVRQLAVTGLGREEPTLFLTNHFEARPRDLIMNYARRNRVEDGLGTNVNFFHLDCLSSEVRLNVDLDVALTVIAHGCYRWLARQLKGFDKAKPKQLYRKFVETGGVIEVAANRTLVVTFDRRSHNPILREAALYRDCRTIPWLSGYRVEFHYRWSQQCCPGTRKMSVDFPLRKSAIKSKDLTDVEHGFRQLKDVLAMRPIYHQIENRVKAHIFVAALALLIQRLLGRRLEGAAVDLSPTHAMQALSTVRLVTFRRAGQGERRGISGGCPNARKVLKALKLVDLHPPSPPEGEKTVT
jgi:hypothetical protein